MTDIPGDDEFRAAGFTGAAKDYPLTDAACEVLALFNGVPVSTMPRAWGYAPNPGMQEWLNLAGEKHAEGRTVIAPGPRLLSLDDLRLL